MSTPKLFDHRMADGSRNFADLPEVAWFDNMREHLGRLVGARETEYITDRVTEMWLDFDFQNYHFSVNNQYGWYSLFVDNPECSDAVLTAVIDHFAQINPE